MAADVVSASTEFDIFAARPVQTSKLETLGTSYKPIAALDQSDLEFLIFADQETYIDLNIQLYIRGKLTKADGTDLELTDTICVANNLLNSLRTMQHFTYWRYNSTLGGPVLLSWLSQDVTVLRYGGGRMTSHKRLLV